MTYATGMVHNVKKKIEVILKVEVNKLRSSLIFRAWNTMRRAM